ncbi:MAG: oxygen-independent coproporphyrinogen III oxidase [Pseudomonadota bacterium]
MRPSFDQDLIDRYGGPGPRYTSYPTAVQFSEDFGPDDYARALAESNSLPIPANLSLYVHVPFCSSPCFYCACNRVITRSKTAGDRFLDHLESEMDLIAPRIDADRQVEQLHLGGGTPTFLNLCQLDRLTNALRRRFTFAPQAQLGLEIDPRTVTPQGIHDLHEMGYNRLSIGVQDLDIAVQNAVNRVHDEAMVFSIYGAARAVGFDSVSVDLIYGLPLQTTAGFAHTIETICELKPDRVSLFNYAHLPQLFKAQRQIPEEQMPSPATKLAIFRNALARLLDVGYEFIGMDHFALPEDSLVKARQNGTLVRNFQGYSTHGGLDMVSFGPSAISQVADSFAQNTRDLDAWAIALEEGRMPTLRGLNRNTDDCLRAEIIERIMCRGALDYRAIGKLYQLHFERYFERELEALDQLAQDGLLTWNDHGFEVTAAGLLFLRAIARQFDAYLGPIAEKSGRFSRIV